MHDTENPDYEGWTPETDSQFPIPMPQSKKQGVLRKADCGASDDDKEPTEKRIREWAQIVINFILAVVGVFAVCYYSGQLGVMKGQLAEIVRQFPEIQAQRIATQGQLTQQQDAFKVTERAWISLSGTHFQYVTDPHNIPRADAVITFTNTGPSPAFKIHFWVCGRVRSTAPIVGPEPKSSAPCFTVESGVMGTNVIQIFEVPDIFQAVKANSLPKTAFESGQHLYVWGRVTYQVLADKQRHFTSFCLLSAGGQLAPCANGNDAD